MKLRWLLLLALSFILGMVAQPAAADEACVAYCLRNFGCDPNANSNCRSGCQGACRDETCVSYCVKSINCAPSNPHYSSCRSDCQSACGPAASYGAIAYGRTSGAWGSSYHWGSQAKAESAAMQTCAQHGNDCEVMVWFDRKCGAVAAAAGAVAFWGLGDSEEQAGAEAKHKCEQGGGKDCTVQASECSK